MLLTKRGVGVDPSVPCGVSGFTWSSDRAVAELEVNAALT
jgi:hypothetical protein